MGVFFPFLTGAAPIYAKMVYLLCTNTMASDLIRIATRNSPLALWQANFVRQSLVAHWPNLEVTLLPMTTSGDRFLKDKLLTIGNKGLFVKELEEALLEGKADIAVHSMKDVPVHFPAGLTLNTICTRENPFDALVSLKYGALQDLPKGAIIGTSSLRRETQLLAHRADLNIQPLRGNIHTRLQKLAETPFDAIILAAAGLIRMGMQDKINEIIDQETMLPACGQGALGIECRVNDEAVKQWLTPLHDPITATCVLAERHINAQLGGNCHTPLAVYCSPQNQTGLLVRAKIASPDGQTILEAKASGAFADAQQLAQHCVQQLVEQGAAELLEQHH